MRQMQMLLAVGLVILAIAASGAVAYAADATSNAVAQSGGLTDTLTGATPSPTPRAAAGTPATTTPVTPAASITLPTPTPTPTATVALTQGATTLTLTIPLTVAAALSESVVLTPGAIAPAPEGVVAGTVIANRTNALVRFFAEGNTYDLAALRSAALALSRASNVINLYNCDATLGVNQEGCFWDPYLLERDGFYEIVAGKDAGELKNLILRAAGAPPANQVWIQNRAGRDEQVYYGTQMRDIAEGSVEQFSVEAGGVGVFYLRTCVTTTDGASACEWSSHSAQPGAYYALVEESRPGGVAGTTISALSLQPVIGVEVAAGATVTVTATATAPGAPQTVCTLAVPALNVRSGPGLEYEIVKKVRSTDVEVASVIVTGRTAAGDWLRVDERVAPGGWVIAGSEYLNCAGDATALPIVAESELPPTPTPLPVVEAPAASPTLPDALQAGGTADTSATVDVAATAATATVTDTTAAPLPVGTALITVHNAFDRDVRFTLDQRYRLEQGPSEFDLLPGGAVEIIVFAGPLPFTASSPWQGLSGNTSIQLAEGERRDIYVVFYYDEVDKKWYLAPV